MKKLHLEQEIEELRAKVLEMSSLAGKALDKSLKALNERDSSLAEEVIEGDRDVNQKQCDIDEYTLSVLAREQPVARDLRFILGSTQITANLERVGDQSVNIAERILLLSQRPPLPHNPLLEELATCAHDMYKRVIDAYNRNDADMALTVCDMDTKCDTLNMKILKHYMDYMVQESRSVERAVHQIILARSLERVGDLATNIAESVIFIIKGIDIRQTCHPY
ncbi:phosphate signaling complex protein PhoU [Desulfohalovibrio reitneri]|uniref:phosphate signaling complex protein PhoU n=1 Tax=Desulfohalovibrio reitneri TaxID=1307759 RepID=UPI0004A6FF03|nr:phosphate signaling complex protein PhoU [Desulfohalovibrio reitneri]